MMEVTNEASLNNFKLEEEFLLSLMHSKEEESKNAKSVKIKNVLLLFFLLKIDDNE
jgi:hypothetical protein